MSSFHKAMLREASHVVRRALRKPMRLARREVLPRMIPPAPKRVLPAARQIRVVGLLSSASGIGKSARLCIEVLHKSGYAVSTHDVSTLFASHDGVAFQADASFAAGGFSIYHLNPSMLLPGVLRSGLSRYYRSCNIAYWAWELENLPQEWIEAIRFVHAILVPSRFCQATLQRYTSKRVLVVPHPIATDVQITGAHRFADARRDNLWRDGVLRVVNVFRFGSSFERKNPIALVKAFRRAFGTDNRTQLILKASDGARFPVEMERLRTLINGQKNIDLIDEIWPEDRIARLIESADVYASLHRSEGFGLPLAEAMMAGVPVMATNWSGNTDFCSPKYSFSIDYRLVPFRDDHGDYEQVSNARWAEPSIEHAAEQLRRLGNDRQGARERAREARTMLCRHIASHQYRDALTTILADVASESAPALSVSRNRG